MSTTELPWRGSPEDRPADLAIPGGLEMPLRLAGQTRKRWRYVAVFSEELMLCAARVEVGPLGQTFWAIWDREREAELIERTLPRLPLTRGQVWTEGSDGARIDFASPSGCVTRIEARHRRVGRVSATLRFGPGKWVESVNPADQAHVWTRKRCDAPIAVELLIGSRRIELEGRGIEDETAGYHPRHTCWSWSAGVGTARDGRSIGWNLVAGANDPPLGSERAIWIDGAPASEPAPVLFEGTEGLDGVRFEGGERLAFTAGRERSRAENLGLVRYSYRQPFGTFAGALSGGVELERGFGVMEAHDAVW